MQDYEEKIKSLKAELFAEALTGTNSAHILEVGMGTGPNLPYYAQQPVSQLLTQSPARCYVLAVCSFPCTSSLASSLHVVIHLTGCACLASQLESMLI